MNANIRYIKNSFLKNASQFNRNKKATYCTGSTQQPLALRDKLLRSRLTPKSKISLMQEVLRCCIWRLWTRETFVPRNNSIIIRGAMHNKRVNDLLDSVLQVDACGNREVQSLQRIAKTLKEFTIHPIPIDQNKKRTIRDQYHGKERSHAVFQHFINKLQQGNLNLSNRKAFLNRVKPRLNRMLENLGAPIADPDRRRQASLHALLYAKYVAPRTPSPVATNNPFALLSNNY